MKSLSGRAGGTWRTLTDEPAVRVGEPLTTWRLLVRVVVSALVVLAVVGTAGGWAIRQAAEREGLRETEVRADQITLDVVRPNLTRDLWSGDEKVRDVASERLRAVMVEVIDGGLVTSVKIWDPDGTVLAADDPSLVGRRFTQPAGLGLALEGDGIGSIVVDGDELEHSRLGDEPLLEVFRVIEAPEGRTAFVEVHSPYDSVDRRTAELWRVFAGLAAASLVVLAAILLPLVWTILQRARREREALLQRSVDASLDERRRIAGDLHDGIVQTLAATTVSMDDLAGQADRHGADGLSRNLRLLATTMRTSLGSQRSLLLDLYPPVLGEDGLERALDDLVAPLRVAGTETDLDVDTAAVAALDGAGQELVRRIAQETLRNVVRHAQATTAGLRLRQIDDRVALEVWDDGVGFDPARLAAPASGHLGTRVIVDLAREAGAVLALRTAPGEGTTWRLDLRPAVHGGERG
ncbi:MAG: sensor histidine kinase [Phycicoccus sp.]